jgi:MOSC domain-containing protein YiiM
MWRFYSLAATALRPAPVRLPDVPGRIEHIHVRDTPMGPVEPVESVRALADRGLEGDRNCVPEGATAEPGDALTLVEAEALEYLAAEHDIHLPPGGTNRNVTTRGVDLNALVGREFVVGKVRCLGVELCEPCLGLTEITGEPGVLRALVHRGGLRADILTSGRITVGDAVGEADRAERTSLA